MGYTLTIDQGNTSSKVTVFDSENAVVATYRYATISVEDLCPLFEQYSLSGVIYCSVSRFDAKLVESLRCMGDIPVLVFTHETEVPIGVDYKTPESLGLDRLAAAVGASQRYGGQSMLVVDAGTAITIDLIDGSPVFRGGNISPGVALRFKSLHDYTGALPKVEQAGDLPTFGYDTVTAIRAGVVNGVLAEIMSAYSVAQRQHGCDKMIITGGDAEFIHSLLDPAVVDMEVVPDLVAEGLNRILRYNEDI